MSVRMAKEAKKIEKKLQRILKKFQFHTEFFKIMEDSHTGVNHGKVINDDEIS